MRKLILFIALSFLLGNQFLFSQVPSYIPTNGLVAYYPFNGNANEEIGNTNNGVVNGATLTTDVNGNANKAYSFNGTNSYINLPINFYGGQTANVVSFSLRFKVNSNGDYYIWNKDGSWLEAGIYTTTNGAFGIFWAYPNQYNGIVTTNGSIVPNNWYEAVIIINGTNSKIYLNGIEQIGITVNNPSNNIGFGDAGTCGVGINRFGFKKSSCSPGNYFNGILDEFMLFSRILTPQEVSNLYTSCTPPAPTGSLTQTFCATPAPTVASLTATGTGIQWYAAATGGTALATTTALVNGTTYYASQTVSGCESTTRLAVTVTLNDPQITASATNVCSGTPVTLSASTTAAVTQNCNLPANLQTGLVGYWPFCGNANDVSGNANNGTVNGATLTTDRFGNANSAYSFNGSNTYIDVTNAFFNNGWQDYTLSLWFNANSTIAAPNSGLTMLNTLPHTGLGVGFSYNNSQRIYHFKNSDPSTTGLWNIYANDSFNTFPINLNSWYNIGIVKNGNNYLYYLNGNLDKSTTANLSPISYLCSMRFGGITLGTTFEIFNGKLDDIAIYNRALSPSEIAQLYTATPTYLWSTGDTTATINPTPAATTTYWCDVTVNGVTCRKSITINVNPPAIVTVNNPLNSSICSNATNVTVLGTSASNYTSISWTSTTGTTILNSFTMVPIVTPSAQDIINNQIVLTITALGSSPCPAVSRTLTITVNTTPAPTGALTQTFCATPAPTLASLTATGTGIQWYAAATGGTALATTTALANGTTYYASQTVSGCESTRLPVTVSLNDPQITASATTVCSGTPVTLTASTTATVAQNCNLPANLQTGLVGYWPFCGNANDVSGNANNGTVNGATLTTDRFGNANSAYSFDGNDYLSGNLNIDLNLNFTISSWVNPQSLNGGHFVQLGIDDGVTGCNGIGIGKGGLTTYTNDMGNNFIELSSCVAWNPSSYQIANNIWSLLTITKNNQGILYFVNGSQVHSISSTSILPSNGNFYFGSTGPNPTGPCYYKGMLDEILVYNRALSPSEIAQLYTATPTYLWSTGATTATINPSPTSTTTYWCDVTVNGVTCRKSITINVNPNITPTFTQVAAICYGATAPTLPTNSIENITGTWSPAFDNTATTLYTFTPTAGLCATPSTMTVTVNTTPVPTGNATQTFCATPAPTFASLTATGTGIQWYAAATGGTALATTTALVNGTTYYASQTVSTCESNRLPIKVSLNDPQITASATTVCSGTLVSLTANNSSQNVSNCTGVSNYNFLDFTSIAPVGNYTNLIKKGNEFYLRSNNDVFKSSNLTGPYSSLNFNSQIGINEAGQLLGFDNLNRLHISTSHSGLYLYDGVNWLSNGLSGFGTAGQYFTKLANGRIVISKGGFLRDIYYSDDNGMTWINATNIDVDWNNIVIASNGDLYASSGIGGVNNKGVIKSTDNGSSWLYINSNLGIISSTGIFKDCVNNLFIVGDNKIFKSTNDGTTWNVIANIPPIFTSFPSYGQFVVTSSGDFYYHGENYLFLSNNQGVTWTQITNIPGNFGTIREVDGNIVVCSTQGLYAKTLSNNTTFLWSTGETTAAINPSPTTNTTYWCDVTVNGVTCRKSITINVNPNITPTFTQVAAICYGATAPILPTNSIENITGTWSPVFDNTATTLYTFTPTAGLCATTATMTVTVNPIITPTFTQEADICYGATAPTLPTNSIENITGTWSPAFNNTATTLYTFTPDTGLCASTATMSVTVKPLPAPPTGVSVQTFCANIFPTLQSIIVNPSNVNWYSSSTSTTALPSTTYLPPGVTTYYASQYDSTTGCESNIRLAVSVNVLFENSPSTIEDQTYCSSDEKTIGDIKTGGLNIVWYTTPNGGTPVSNSIIISSSSTLYAAIFNPITGCESPIRTKVEITIINCLLVSNNLLTINDNDLNDNLNIQNIENFPVNQIEIYNRLGELVWKTDYYNNADISFQGKANVSGVYQINSYLPTGTYYYILKYYDPYHIKYNEMKSFLYINNNN